MEQAREAPEGDLRAFEELVARHQGRVATNCRYLTRAPDDAPDLAQEVLVKAFFSLSGFEGKSKFSTWLNRIKVNHCLDYLRAREGRIHVAVDEPGVEQAPELQVAPRAERALQARDERERIREALDALPETLRVPLILRDYDRLAYQEIADALGLGLSAVKMRIKRAREEFRRRFDAETAPEPAEA